MSCIFRHATSLCGEVFSFDTRQVTSMSLLFSCASSLNAEVSSFDTSLVMDFSWMCDAASSFHRCVEGDVTHKRETSCWWKGSSGRISSECEKWPGTVYPPY